MSSFPVDGPRPQIAPQISYLDFGMPTGCSGCCVAQPNTVPLQQDWSSKPCPVTVGAGASGTAAGSRTSPVCPYFPSDNVSGLTAAALSAPLARGPDPSQFAGLTYRR